MSNGLTAVLQASSRQFTETFRDVNRRQNNPNNVRLYYSALLWWPGGKALQGYLSLYMAIRKASIKHPKLQALAYDILPSTTAVFSYAIGPRKLSANEQCFVGTQTLVSWLQTTQIKQGVSFIAANKVYASTNKATIV